MPISPYAPVERRSAILARMSATRAWPVLVRSQRLPSCRSSARSARQRSVLSSACPDGAYPLAASHLNSIIRCWMLNGSRCIVRLANPNRRELGYPARGLADLLRIPVEAEPEGLP